MSQKVVTIQSMITVGDLAGKIDVPVAQLVGELFKNGIMATVNQRIDFETAEIIIGELGLEVELQKETEAEVSEETEAPKKSERSSSVTAETRPPVVAVMGHVDHGKTSLLDAILDLKVASGEAGGITQHISAYQTLYNERKITLLDTPGHEAFAALRQHGARLTDVVVIVVAADDGVKPQTVEAIKFAKAAHAKIIVAINKIDKTGADANRTKQSLAEAGLNPEEWGGDTVTVEVSAKTKQGINDLLDLILLMVDIEELKADSKGLAEGIVIESHLEQGKGALVTALIEHGELRTGDFVVVGSTYGRIRTLSDWKGVTLTEGGPSTPVRITGLKELPEFGDYIIEVKSEKEARAKSEEKRDTQTSKKLNMTSSDLLSVISKNMNTKEVPVIVKADVQGSLTSVTDSIRLLENEELRMQIIGSGIGNISESDVQMAATSKAIIYAFNVQIAPNVAKLAERDGVAIRKFNVIYELLDDAKEVLTKLLTPEIVTTELGKLNVKGVFRTTKDEIICGGEVTKGKVEPGVMVRIMHEKKQVSEAEVVSVKRQSIEAKEVFEGEMCGLQLKVSGKVLLEEGDKLEFYKQEEVARSL